MWLITLVNNLANIEAAASVGDEYSPTHCLLGCALIDIGCALLGNPFPSCVYIGHPNMHPVHVCTCASSCVWHVHGMCTHRYRKHPHVDVRVTSSDFADQLAASRGLIASPSRGVVTQARAWHVRTCTPCMHARAHPAGPCVC